MTPGSDDRWQAPPILVPLLLLFSWGGTSIVEKCKREVKRSSQDRYMESDNMVNMFPKTKINIDFPGIFGEHLKYDYSRKSKM